MASVFERLRREYHQRLCKELLSYRKNSRILNIADKGSKASTRLAKLMVDKIDGRVSAKPLTPQALGERFPKCTLAFLQQAFAKLQHVRPGTWEWSVGQARVGIAAFVQYGHLARLQELVNAQPELKAALGGDYLIIPDLVVSRKSLSDADINRPEKLVDVSGALASLTPLRERNAQSESAILHASISCKWTMRSDRAQNTRTEALNLIRNRKGGTPHIVVVTMEPLPGRLASIAMGTGDIDCTYHGALYELRDAANESRFEDQAELLNDLIEGRRLRDISDLPLDLAI